MSIKIRLALLLGLLLVGFVGAMFWLRYLEREEREELLASDRETRARLLNHWIDAVGRTLPEFIAETAQSEAFVKLVAAPSLEGDARKKIEEALASIEAHSLWILNSDGTERWHVQTTGSAPSALPIDPADATRLLAETPSPRFFAETPEGLLETGIRRLTGSAPQWVAVARRWDANMLRRLSELTESNVTLRSPTELAHPPARGARVVLFRPLADWRGRTVAVLRLEHAAGEVERALTADRRKTRVFFAFGAMVIVAMGLALSGWVLRPLHRIGQSLAKDDPQPAREVSRERDEFGQVAQLVVSSFEQRESLRREVAERARAQAALERSEAELRQNLDERARLGRDLHDGVIQSLYAAGMGLAGIRDQLHPDQSEAATRLEQTRGVLNETIHDVRNFIVGLEPEALKLQTFSQALDALFEALHAMREFRSTKSIDEGVAASLSLAQRVHALQIAREAVSNALRHGAATHVHVALRMVGEFAEFEVRDNGGGFDAAAVSSPGKGLGNFAERARELGAELSVQSKPGEGACVTITFSIHPK